MSHGHAVAIPADAHIRVPDSHPWAKMHLVAFAVGGIALAAALGLGMGNLKQFYFSYLVAFLYFLGLGLGSLFFVMAQFLTNAGWGVVVRRFAENHAAPLVWMGVLFLPVVAGMHDLFHWTHADAVAHDPILKAKASYLNQGSFLVRAVLYFGIWAGLAAWFRKQSLGQDATGDMAATRRMTAVSAPGTLLFALSLTFAAFDWGMSLDPHWFSTMWGVWFFSGATVAAYALLAVMHLRAQARGLLRGVVNVEHFHDLGKLVFAFTVFWTYIAFSQYFLIWYSNIPEETAYFQHRMGNSWEDVGVFLMVGHFVIPFFFLMSRHVKRHPVGLLVGALWMLFVHYVDIYYAVMPNLHHEGVHFSPIDVLAFVGVGGLFFGGVFLAMRKGALIPERDPRLHESLAHQNF